MPLSCINWNCQSGICFINKQLDQNQDEDCTLVRNDNLVFNDDQRNAYEVIMDLQNKKWTFQHCNILGLSLATMHLKAGYCILIFLKLEITRISQSQWTSTNACSSRYIWYMNLSQSTMYMFFVAQLYPLKLFSLFRALLISKQTVYILCKKLTFETFYALGIFQFYYFASCTLVAE